jgi:hypothetical protein
LWIEYEPGFPVTYQRVSIEQRLKFFPARQLPSSTACKKNAGGPEDLEREDSALMSTEYETKRIATNRKVIVEVRRTYKLFPFFGYKPKFYFKIVNLYVILHQTIIIMFIE